MRTLTLLLLCALLTGCSRTGVSDASDMFSGTYVATIGNVARPLIRIYRRGGQYMLSRTENGRWTHDGVPMETVTRAAFEQYLGHRVQGEVNGVTYESATLLNLPVGFTEGKFVSHTGYLLVTAAGPVEVRRERQ
jgi:hypothetical protein